MTQVGSHGAGLINHMFMRKGTSFLEIVPCGFDDPFHDDSFQVPARVQNYQFAFKLMTVSPMLCSRSQAELGDPEGTNVKLLALFAITHACLATVLHMMVHTVSLHLKFSKGSELMIVSPMLCFRN